MITEAVGHLVAENTHFLAQLKAALSRIPPETYRRNDGPFARGGIGKHVRHVLEFYRAVLSPPPLDYDARPRDQRIETDPAAADAAIGEITSELTALADTRRASADGTAEPLAVACPAGGGEATTCASSLERELLFLSSHTVHHFAIVALIMQHYEVAVDPDFGVAPSTLEYERSLRNGS